MARLRLAIMASLIIAVIALAGPALAQGGSGERPPKPGIVHRNPQPRTGNPPRVSAGGHVLPFTGSDLTVFVVAAALTIGIGAALVKGSQSLGLRP